MLINKKNHCFNCQKLNVIIIIRQKLNLILSDTRGHGRVTNEKVQPSTQVNHHSLNLTF